jgi:CBS-domain-containing membrane protein
MEDACKTVTVDKPIQEIIPLMAENNDPVAVVSEEGKLKGVVVTGALLAGLAEGLESNVE